MIFAEPITSLAVRYAHRTHRLDVALTTMAYELGGEAGVRVAATLKLGDWSADTLLALIRRQPESPTPPSGNLPPLRVLGVDDWAKRKGLTYGTIVCDLERRCVVDLLPDRESATLAAWLQRHPSVEIVCRDRAVAYAEGIRHGAPHAIQIADRFQLLMNLSDAVARVVDRHRAVLKIHLDDVIRLDEPMKVQPVTRSYRVKPVLGTAPIRPPSPIRAHQALRRALRVIRWDEVRQLHVQGLSQREIGRRLKMDHHTIRRIIQSKGCPDNGNRWRSIHPVADYLNQRWDEGIYNARQLHRELKAMGHTINYHAVMYFVHPLRRASQAAREALPESATPSSAGLTLTPTPVTSARPRRLSARQATRLIGNTLSQRSDQDNQALQQLCAASPELAAVHTLVTNFQGMLRERQPERFDSWLAQATGSNIVEFKALAESLQRDKAAVVAALSSHWSSGQVEGQINRLKLIKRMMYGRGKLDLLRKRVLYKPTSS